MEEVFYGCFEVRLDFDAELDRMRSQFLLIRQQQSHYLIGVATEGQKQS